MGYGTFPGLLARCETKTPKIQLSKGHASGKLGPPVSGKDPSWFPGELKYVHMGTLLWDMQGTAG